VSRISRDTVLHVAELARLSLSDAEAGAAAEELGTILEYAETLRTLDTSGVEPTAHPIPLPTPLRDDRPAPALDPERALANAPQRDATAFVVPKILDADEA
jgi:aspartyl-tRNA(Asn)/glutamyl-tRNA(Gln) amidotransferase subunit C